VVSGGYPEPLSRSPERARQWHRQYLKSIIDRDVQDIAQVKDGREVGRLLEMMALRTGSLLNVMSLSKELGLHRGTVDHYLAILERLFLIRSLQSWHRHPAKRLIKTRKFTRGQWSGGDAFGSIRRGLAGTATVWGICWKHSWSNRSSPKGVDRSRPALLALSGQGSGGSGLVITRGEKVGIEVKASRSVNAKAGAAWIVWRTNAARISRRRAHDG
jgi:hypothetical protein